MRKYTTFFIFLSFLIISCGVQESDSKLLKTELKTLIGDSCSDTIETITEGEIRSSTIGYSNSFVAPQDCSDSYSADKIFRFTINETSKVVAEILDSEIDTVLYIKTACDVEKTVICNDDKNNYNYMSKVEVVLEAGDYFIVVDGYGTTSEGEFSLKLDISSAADQGCELMFCPENYSCTTIENTPQCICEDEDCDISTELNYKDIIITELMVNPSGSDRYNEWIEIYNTTNNTILLDKFKVKKDSINYNLRSSNIEIKPKEYFVIARSEEINVENIKAVIPNMSLTNSGEHTISIHIGDIKLDDVTYFGSQSGISTQLYNGEWCDSKGIISENNSDKGTPGYENISCSDLCGDNCSNHGVCDIVDGSCLCEEGYSGDKCSSCTDGYHLENGVCVIQTEQFFLEKDIIITEIFSNPLGSSAQWIEIYNRTDRDISLDGLKIIKDEQIWNISDGNTIFANSYFVIGDREGGDTVIPTMDLTTNKLSTLTIEINNLTFDTIDYENCDEGISRQLDIDNYGEDYISENWCNGDIDSLGEENRSCFIQNNLCEEIDCNNGVCIVDNNQPICECYPGYSGDFCEICDSDNPNCPTTPQLGDLIITEIMIDPDGGDQDNEFIEIFNNSNHSILVENLKIDKDGVEQYDVEIVNSSILPNSYFLIARGDLGYFNDADGYSPFILNNSEQHTISLIVNDQIFDTVTYNNSTPSKSLQLDKTMFGLENSGNFWCDSTTLIDQNGVDFGTPGDENIVCGPCSFLSCSINGYCSESNGNAECVCNDGYHSDQDGNCIMDQYCGVLYDNVRDLTGDELKIALRELTGIRYNPVEYDISRKIMYREIDKDHNNEVQCVYTGRKMRIIDDEPLDSRWGSCNNFSCVCSNAGMNTEHTWPQSKFDKQEPMKGDIHHLFPTDGCTNGKRSSYPFGNVIGVQGRYGNDDYGYSFLGTNNGKTVFQPAAPHKGDLARAIFYFIVRYGNYSNFLDDEQEAILRQWAQEDPVSDKERVRNNKIELIQWNRNPFVDCPQFIDLIEDL